MKKFRRILGMTLVLTMLLVLCACGDTDTATTQTKGSLDNTGDGAVLTLKLGGTVAEDHPITQAEYKFAELVEELSEGQIVIEVYPNCQLGAAREMFEAVQMGNLDIVESGSMVLGNFTDQIKFLNLPFLFNGREAAIAWKQTEENQQLMQSIAEETGLYEFGYLENGSFQLETRATPGNIPQDLQGMKFRSQESECFMQTLSVLGANPTAMAFSELYTALQQGVVDGHVNPLVVIYANGFDEVTPNITMVNLFYDLTGMYISYDRWKEMSEEQQNILIEAMEQATLYEFELLSAQAAEVMEALEQSCTIYNPTDAEMEQWKTAVEPVYDWFSATYGTENIKHYFEIIDQCNADNP